MTVIGKIAVIGGGSTYTPEFVDGFIVHRDEVQVEEIALHDISAERLEVVGGLVERMVRPCRPPHPHHADDGPGGRAGRRGPSSSPRFGWAGWPRASGTRKSPWPTASSGRRRRGRAAR
jgi:hypothetical protein